MISSLNHALACWQNTVETTHSSEDRLLDLVNDIQVWMEVS